MFYSKNLMSEVNVKHCFFSRKNGVSSGIYESLNCGIGSKDDANNVKKNLSMDFSIRHKESYLKCLKEFLEKKKRSFLLSQSLIAQKICAKVLKKAVVE